MAFFRRAVLHPFLMAVYPIIALLAYNIDQVVAWSALRALIISLVIAMILYLMVYTLVQEKFKAAVAVTIFLFLFYTYGHAYSFIEDIHVFSLNIGRHRYLFLIWLALLGLGLWWVFGKPRDLSKLHSALNIAGCVALLLPVMQIAVYVGFESNPDVDTANAASSGHEINLSASSGSAEGHDLYPDIYYIILDAYTRGDTLREYFNYDNEPFLSALEAMGFYVARCSQSNYSNTQLSLASSLNLNYLDTLNARGESITSSSFLNRLIATNAVRKALERVGYRTVVIESGFSPTEWQDADVYISLRQDLSGVLNLLGGISPFEALVMRTSGALLLYESKPLLPARVRSFLDAAYTQHRQRILFAFDQLNEVPLLPGPKFVFVHIIAPHEPFVFGPLGEIVGRNTPFSLNDDWDTRDAKAYHQGYRDQLIYVNTRIEETTREILEKSVKLPIIIFQGDHGTLARVSSQSARMTILNAYYLPDGGDKLIYDSISPVNTFRLVFDHYFGSNLGFLEDTSFYYDKMTGSFLTIPNQLQGCAGRDGVAQ